MKLITEEAEQIVSERSPDNKVFSFRLKRNKSLQDQISIREDLTQPRIRETKKS